MRAYAGIPHAQRPGLFVEENAALLRRYAYLEQRLALAAAGHLPGTATIEFKHALARHAWEDGQHADALRRRIVTMRTSAHLLEECPDPALEALCDELERTTDEAEFAAGLFGVVKPALLRAYLWHLEVTNPVADYPTARELEIIVREESHQLAWGAEALAELAGGVAAQPAVASAAAGGAGRPSSVAEPLRPDAAAVPAAGAGVPAGPLPGAAQGGPPVGSPRDPEPGAAARALAWQRHLATFLGAAGGVTGREARGDAEAPRSAEPFRLSPHPRRDPRFTIHFQFGEPGDVPASTVPEKLIFMMRGRLNELAATENPASAVYEMARGGDPMPWDAVVELLRHMWDEARHSMLGQAVIESLGRDIREWPLRIGPGYSYLSVGALERYAHLGLNVEQGMMRYPPGKREEFEWCRDVARYPLAAMYQDYDWSDEVYHTQIARRWVARLLGDAEGRPAGAERMRAFAAQAGGRMGARTKAISDLWYARRSEGRTLSEGDALPPGEPGDPGGASAAPNEYAAPEITLTKEAVDADLERVRHAE